jgi:hypothetical protein
MAEASWLVLRRDLNAGTSEGACPDIILGGPKPDPKYTHQYDTAFNRTGKFNGTNYVYVRARNGGTDRAIGSVAVFATRLGSLQNQSEWVRLHTGDGRDSTNIWAEAGSVGLNGAPLIWEPGEAPPPDAPWCLIAEIDGDGYPPIQVPQTVTDKASFDAWVADQQRLNYVVVEAPAVVPVPAPSFGWSRMVNLANADATTLDVSLTCTKGPAGGSLSFSFDRNDSSGKAIGVGKTLYQVNAVYSQTRTVPPDFSSTVSVVYSPASDNAGDAEFSFQIATESSDGGGGDLGTSGMTPVASYKLSFGQTPGQTTDAG